MCQKHLQLFAKSPTVQMLFFGGTFQSPLCTSVPGMFVTSLASGYNTTWAQSSISWLKSFCFFTAAVVQVTSEAEYQWEETTPSQA